MKTLIISISIISILICAAVTVKLWKSVSSPSLVIEQYLRSDFSDRYRYVINGDDIKSVMEKWYNGQPHKVGPISVSKNPVITVDEHDVYDVEFNGISCLFYVKLINGKWMINWPATVRYCEMPLTQLKAERCERPSRMRLIADLSDYYNYEFRGKRDEFISLSLHDQKTSVHGYIRRNEIETGLYEKLKGGKEILVLVDLSFMPKNIDGNDNSDCALISFMKSGWTNTDLTAK